MAPVHRTQAQMQTPLEEELSDTSLLWLEAGAGLLDVVKGLFMVRSELYWVWGPNSKYKLHVNLETSREDRIIGPHQDFSVLEPLGQITF